MDSLYIYIYRLNIITNIIFISVSWKVVCVSFDTQFAVNSGPSALRGLPKVVAKAGRNTGGLEKRSRVIKPRFRQANTFHTQEELTATI